MEIAGLIFTVLAALAGVITVLPLFGIELPKIGRRQPVPPESADFRYDSPNTRAWVALGMVTLSLILSACAAYYFFRPRTVEKIVEKPVEKIVEKIVPQECPKIPVPPHPKKLPPKSPTTAQNNGIQQSNSGGINVQQATTGENSPIINSPITVGDVPKRISPADLIAITQYLENAKAKTRVQITAAQNSNAIPFAHDVYKAFTDAHWPMEGDGVSEPIVLWGAGKKFEGVTIICKGPKLAPNEVMTVQGGEPLFYIGTVLKSLQVPTEIDRDPDQKDADLIIIRFNGMPN